MSEHHGNRPTKARLSAENEELRRHLEEAEQTLEAMRRGAADASVAAAPPGGQSYALSDAEHVYRALVETLNGAALVVDPGGTILFSNQRFCDLMKAPMEDVVGHQVTAFAARPQQPLLKALLKDARSKPLQRHLTLRAADGTAVSVRFSARLLRAGENQSICLVATDLTELEDSADSQRVLREHQQALQESEARFRAIFESSQDAVVILNDEGVCVQVNPAAATVFGLPLEKLAGRRLADFIDLPFDFSTIWRRFLAERFFRGELRVADIHAQIRSVDVNLVANILPGRHLAVLHDITERQQAEQALLDANAQLQVQSEELQTQAEELRVQTDELRVANEELTAREEELRVTNEALRESESRYRELVQNANSAIIRWKADGTITFFNEYAQEFFGYTEKEAVGRNVSFLVPAQESTGTDLSHLARDIVAHPERYVNHVNENIRRDGRRVWMAWTNRPILDWNGQAAEILTVGTDISERKQAEEALRQSEERYRRLFDEDLTGDFIATPDGKVVECNPAFARIYGFADRKQAAQSDISQFNPADWTDLMARLRVECKVEGYQSVHRRPDGREIHVVANVIGRFNETAELTEVQGYIYDDTERKHTEGELRSAALFPEQNPSPVLRVARDGTLLYANGASAFLLRSWDCRPGQAVPEEIRRHIAEAADSGKATEADVVCGAITYSFSIAPVASEGYANLYARDITERKEAEEALRKSEEKFAKAFRSSPIAVAVTRVSDGRIIEVNAALLRLLHFRRDEVIGRTTLDLDVWVDVNDRSHFIQELSAAGSVRDREYRLRTRDGEIVTIHLSAELLEFAGERCLLSTLVDVTERRRAEEALRESEERLKRAQEIAHLGSWELDLVNDRLSWSDEVYRIFGLEPQEFRATYEAFLEAVHPDDRAAVDAAYSESVREGRDTYEVEHRIVRKSTAEVRVVHEKCEHFRDVSGRIIRSIGMVHDVTERKHAEEALRELNATLETKVAERTAQLEHRARQLQRLTLELSEAEDRERRHLAEILHDDLQQQLAAAKFHLSLLSNRARSDPSQQTMIGQVDRMLMDAIQKSRNLSHELSPAVLYQSGLTDALSWLAEQIQTRHGLVVAVDAFGEVSVASDALRTFLYRTAQELLFNVVKHARVGRARIRIRCLGRCICLSVSDRGRGFDPLDLRETAGFGLLSIRERIELLGGRMKIRSAPGHGATFHIVVPDQQEETLLRREESRGVILESPLVSPAAAISGAVAAQHAEARLRVLLADDHEIVREGLASLLQEEAGIEVVGQAANGREAVDLAARLRPDVVVMDVAMPLINGDEATRQIRAHLPQTRIVALSMYEEADLVERMRRAGAETYVLKTAPAEVLLAAIRGQPPAHTL
jgi:PAS domain S-box-containing protein